MNRTGTLPQWEIRTEQAPTAEPTVALDGCGDVPLRDCWDLLALLGVRFLCRSRRTDAGAEYLLVGPPLPSDGGVDIADLICDECLQLHIACKAWLERSRGAAATPWITSLASRPLFPGISKRNQYEIRGGALQVFGWCECDEMEAAHSIDLLGRSHGEDLCRAIAKSIGERYGLRQLDESWEKARRERAVSGGADPAIAEIRQDLQAVRKRLESADASRAGAAQDQLLSRIEKSVNELKQMATATRASSDTPFDLILVISGGVMAFGLIGGLIWTLLGEADRVQRLTLVLAGLALLGTVYGGVRLATGKRK